MIDYSVALNYLYIFVILSLLLTLLLLIEGSFKGKRIDLSVTAAKEVFVKAVVISAVMTLMTAVYRFLGIESR